MFFNKFINQQVLIKVACFLGFYIFSKTIFITFCAYPDQTMGPAHFEASITGKAPRPFIYRALIPFIVRKLAATIKNTTFFKKYKNRFSVNHLQRELNLQAINKNFVDEWLIYTRLSILILTFYGMAMSYLIYYLYKISFIQSALYSATSLFFLPVFFGPYPYIYDFFTLTIFPLAFLFLLKNRMFFYYLCFILGAINRETAGLMVPLFYVIYNKKFRFVHIAVQLAIYLLILFWIRNSYADNPGVTHANYFFENITEIFSFSTLRIKFVILSIFGLLVFGWKKKDMTLKKLFYLFFVPTGVLWLFLGRFPEIRVFYECYFLFVLLSIPTLINIMNFEKSEV